MNCGTIQHVPRVYVLLAAICFGTTGTAQALGPSGRAGHGRGAVRIAVGGALLLLVARALPRAGGAVAARDRVAAHRRGRRGLPARVLRGGRAHGSRGRHGRGARLRARRSRAIAGRLVDGEPLSGRWALATALACAGVSLLVLGGGGAAVDAAGVALAVVAGRGLRDLHDPRQAAAAARPRARARDGGVVLASAPWSCSCPCCCSGTSAWAGDRRRPGHGRCSSARSRRRWRTCCSPAAWPRSRRGRRRR